MRSQLLLAMLLTACLPWVSAAAQGDRDVPGVMFDTDIGPDVDDAGAVAVLHGLADKGEIRLIGMACCTSNEYGAPCLDALNTYFRRPDLAVGTTRRQGFLAESKYARGVSERFPHDLRSGRNAPSALEVYRKVLAGQRDRSVVVIATGPLNNLGELLVSGPDSLSPLSGPELIRKKVRLLSVMGGRYPEGKEWNFEQDPAAAASVARDWPTPVIYSGYEIGAAIKTGARLQAEAPTTSPVRVAYELYVGPGKDRESWDQTAVLAAIRGVSSHWTSSGPGRVSVDPKTGASRWTAHPEGPHSYLVTRDSAEVVKKAIEDLMVRSPGAP